MRLLRAFQLARTFAASEHTSIVCKLIEDLNASRITCHLYDDVHSAPDIFKMRAATILTPTITPPLPPNDTASGKQCAPLVNSLNRQQRTGGLSNGRLALTQHGD